MLGCMHVLHISYVGDFKRPFSSYMIAVTVYWMLKKIV